MVMDGGQVVFSGAQWGTLRGNSGWPGGLEGLECQVGGASLESYQSNCYIFLYIVKRKSRTSSNRTINKSANKAIKVK